MFGDGTPGRFGNVLTDTAHTTLYRDGRKVAESEEAGAVVYQAPSAPARYRVETEATQSVYDTSTKVTASWEFRSREVQGTAGVLLPVMAVRFGPRLDNASRAPAGVPYQIPVSVERQPGAPDADLKSLTVEVSYDDGQTWRQVVLIRTPSGWTAPVHHPAAGFVSLRAKAVDTAGNTVAQAIIRAYGLRAP